MSPRALTDPERARLRELVDFARALAEARVSELDSADAEIEPFAVVDRGGDELLPVLLGDVADSLETPDGLNRVAGTLLARYESPMFAIASRWWASPDGSPSSPQSREVVRVVVGHREGGAGMTYTGVERADGGVRLAGIWETAEQG
jgi:hypothetical protein